MQRRPFYEINVSGHFCSSYHNKYRVQGVKKQGRSLSRERRKDIGGKSSATSQLAKPRSGEGTSLP
jgi:hypothetical protein